MMEKKEYWNDDIQDLFDVVDLGLRALLKKGKIKCGTYTSFLNDIEKSSRGKLND